MLQSRTFRLVYSGREPVSLNQFVVPDGDEFFMMSGGDQEIDSIFGDEDKNDDDNDDDGGKR